MRALLIYPDIPDTFWSFKHALKFISRKSTQPPLGLLTVASMLPVQWEKKLVNMEVNPLKDKHLEWADMAFISAMSIQRESTLKVLERCRKKGVVTVVGGPLFSTDPQAFDDVDHLVLNEAELTLPVFLEDLRKGSPKHIYTTEEHADISRTPQPMWELINKKKYATMALQFSRGCPYNCDFCNISTLYGRKVRTKSSLQILKELEDLYNQGWRGNIFFVDDNFIGNRRQLKDDVLPAMIEWIKLRGYPFYFKTEASINLADDPELMRLMTEAGFYSVFVGIETPNEESLAECNKIQNKNRDMEASIHKMQQAGLAVDGGFIVGFDNDPTSIFERLSSFIQDSGIVTAMVGLLNAPRGTLLFQRMAKEGRLTEEFTGNNTDLSINFKPRMDIKVLTEGYKKMVQHLYSPEVYYRRVRKFILEFIPKGKMKRGYSWRNIRALLRSMVVIGVVGKERLHYWKLFFWTMFKRPRMFPMAITYAIFGFHFRKVFDKMLSPTPTMA